MASRYIEITKGQRARVDEDDYERLSKFKYFAHWAEGTGTYYAFRKARIGGRDLSIAMARDVLQMYDKNLVVDHINGDDTLDNRKENLRVATHAQNRANCRKLKPKSSKYKGVSAYPSARYGVKWEAYIFFERKKIHIGVYVEEDKAARAYNKAAKELYGEFARLNVIKRKQKTTSNLSDNNKNGDE